LFQTQVTPLRTHRARLVVSRLGAAHRPGGLYAGLEVEQGRDTLMEFYTGALPEELERLKPE
jgi:hypothetical protein